jgi:hypothetical protein
MMRVGLSPTLIEVPERQRSLLELSPTAAHHLIRWRLFRRPKEFMHSSEVLDQVRQFCCRERRIKLHFFFGRAARRERLELLLQLVFHAAQLSRLNQNGRGVHLGLALEIDLRRKRRNLCRSQLGEELNAVKMLLQEGCCRAMQLVCFRKPIPFLRSVIL